MRRRAEQGETGWHRSRASFPCAMWGGGISLAYAVQLAVTLAVAGGLAWLWRSRALSRSRRLRSRSARSSQRLTASTTTLCCSRRPLRSLRPTGCSVVPPGKNPCWQRYGSCRFWPAGCAGDTDPARGPRDVSGFCVDAAARNDPDRHKNALAFRDPSAEVTITKE